jgi:2-oxoglutarate ferredoxin oxidoreductase subunit alpha
MRTELVWKVGGEQGSGIETPGGLFLDACNRLGYYTFGYRHFMSRIMGGHTNYQVRISHRPVYAVGDHTDVFVVDAGGAQESIDHNIHEMSEGGVILADAGMKATVPGDAPVTLMPVPFHGIAGELGSDRYWNMVAMGATCAVTGLDLQAFRDLILQSKLASKGQQVIQANFEALERGYAYVMEHYGEQPHLRIAPVPHPKRRLSMEGDYAAAFGALAAGCRFLAAYPITPASMIMEWMAKEAPKFGGVVVQAEDEMAAILMAIGANYAGARAMTSTSGPGFSLMQEAMGLAGLTETPVVVVDVQRAGPATGLPTKPEQGDLNEMVYGSHGEIPRIVIAPGTYEECFYDMVEAFNLADRHQCPVIVAMDLTLGMGKGTVEALDWGRIRIDRGKILTEEDLRRLGGVYERFANVEDGISPRALPGTPGGVHLNTADEHTFSGRITEDQDTRTAIHDKRLRKIAHVDFPGLAVRGELPTDLLLVGFGSTTGPMWEAMDRLVAAGHRVAVCQLRRLWPFPVAEFQAVLAQARAALVCEHNATGQLAHLIRAQCGGELLPGLRKYNGDPFRPSEIEARAREVMADVYSARIA